MRFDAARCHETQNFASSSLPSASTVYRRARTPNRAAVCWEGPVGVRTNTPPFFSGGRERSRVFSINQIEDHIEILGQFLEPLFFIIDDDVCPESARKLQYFPWRPS